MKTMKLMIILTAFLASEASFATSINDRQQNQRQRIGHGIHNGELTRPEAHRLVKQQKQTYRKEAKFRSDGNFTRKERAVIQRDLNRSSKNIYRKKHNNRSRN